VRRLAAAQDICPVLELTIQQVDLNLLGALVHLDKVHLVITADSEGGLLGQLLCKLSKQGKLSSHASQLTWAAKKSGLAATGTGVRQLCADYEHTALHVGSDDLPCARSHARPGRSEPARVARPPRHRAPDDQCGLRSGVLGSLLCSLAGTPTA
jgi:hypothetical protein